MTYKHWLNYNVVPTTNCEARDIAILFALKSSGYLPLAADMASALVSIGLLLKFTVPTALAAALGSYNVDPSSVSVSGLSAGCFMAAQLRVV